MTGIGEGLIQQVQSWLTYFRALRPVVEMPNIAVGIHVGVDMNKAPLSSCIKAMDAAIDTNPSTTFLVATQSETYKRELEGWYRGHVWFPATGVSRMTQRGMNESIMEFLALSRCSKILAVRGSALSEMAASYGNVRLELIA
jgi:hypothetical protein